MPVVVRRGKGADDPDFVRLFDREFARLVSALAVSAGSVDVAADAVQDAFLQLHRHWGKVRYYDDPGGWVRRVAVHRLRDAQRSDRRRYAALPRLWEPISVDLPESTADVINMVARLPRKQRIAVCLYYIADLSLADIAVALDVSVGTIKSQLHDARSTLRAGMEVNDGI